MYLDDGVFGPTTAEVASTISVYNDVFCYDYPVNSNDTADGVPGILYGRYPGDSYDGGNPWVLTSAYLAYNYYNGASEIVEKNRILSERDLSAWK